MGKFRVNETGSFGLTEKEEGMNLHDYNHALFQNMTFFMDVVWEINMLMGTVVILHDKDRPDKSGKEFSYREAYQDYAENRIGENERPLFEQYMAPQNLKSLKEEVFFDVHLRRQNGGRDLCRFVLTPAFDQYEKLYCVYLGAGNIQGEKTCGQEEAQGEELRRKEQETLERANAMKCEFLTQISHDIRTPMNAIIGMTAIAEKHQDNEDRVAECLRKISLSGKYLLALVDEMLDMSMIESGKLELAEEELDLEELFENLGIILEMQMKERKHKFTVEIRNVRHGKVLGDRRRIDQIIVHLIDNAVKYTAEEGEIALRLEEKPTNMPDACCFEITVEDNGIGMKPENVENVFKPFWRAKDSRVEKIQGSGLGLAITNHIVRMMGGGIYVKSEPERGTKVTMKIFLKPVEDNITFPQLEETKALVVNSDEALCKIAEEILAGLGIESDRALTVGGAIELIQKRGREKKGYCAVILDRGAMGADPVKVIKEIRQCTDGSTAIAVSADSDWSDIEAEARAEGAAEFIGRAYSRSRLIHLFKVLTGEEAETPKSPIQALTERDFSGHRVLMVEDNESNADIVREILEMVGLEIEQVWNGQEAIERMATVEDWYYDIVFMDVQMPIMDGCQAVRAIRGLNRSYAKEVPILAMSANAFEKDIQASLEAGMNEHISKPIDLKKLEDALCRWLKKT